MPTVRILGTLAIIFGGVLLAQPATANEHTRFLVRIENVGTALTLKTSKGPAPAPVSPVVWAVHTDEAPLFSSGQADRGKGLEALAEDGNPGPPGGIPEKSDGRGVGRNHGEPRGR